MMRYCVLLMVMSATLIIGMESDVVQKVDKKVKGFILKIGPAEIAMDQQLASDSGIVQEILSEGSDEGSEQGIPLVERASLERPSETEYFRLIDLSEFIKNITINEKTLYVLKNLWFLSHEIEVHASNRVQFEQKIKDTLYSLSSAESDVVGYLIDYLGLRRLRAMMNHISFEKSENAFIFEIINKNSGVTEQIKIDKKLANSSGFLAEMLEDASDETKKLNLDMFIDQLFPTKRELFTRDVFLKFIDLWKRIYEMQSDASLSVIDKAQAEKLIRDELGAAKIPLSQWIALVYLVEALRIEPLYAIMGQTFIKWLTSPINFPDEQKALSSLFSLPLWRDNISLKKQLIGRCLSFNLNQSNPITLAHSNEDPFWYTITPDGSYAVIVPTGSPINPHAITFIDMNTGTQKDLAKSKKEINHLAISPNGVCIFASSQDGEIVIWNGDKPVARFAKKYRGSGHQVEVSAVVATEDNLRMLIGLENGEIIIWNLKNNRSDSVLVGHTGPIRSIRITPNGAYAVTGSDDKTARVWNLTTGVTEFICNHEEEVTSVAITPDDLYVVTGSQDKSVKIWNLKTKTLENSLIGRTKGFDGVSSVAITSDGTRVVIGHLKGTARIWDITSGTVLILAARDPEMGNIDPRVNVQITPDDAHAITCYLGSGVKIWDLETGIQVPINNDQFGDKTIDIDEATLVANGSRIFAASGIDNGYDVIIWGANLSALKIEQLLLVYSFVNFHQRGLINKLPEWFLYLLRQSIDSLPDDVKSWFNNNSVQEQLAAYRMKMQSAQIQILTKKPEEEEQIEPVKRKREDYSDESDGKKQRRN